MDELRGANCGCVRSTKVQNTKGIGRNSRQPCSSVHIQQVKNKIKYKKKTPKKHLFLLPGGIKATLNFRGSGISVISQYLCDTSADDRTERQAVQFVLPSEGLHVAYSCQYNIISLRDVLWTSQRARSGDKAIQDCEWSHVPIYLDL